MLNTNYNFTMNNVVQNAVAVAAQITQDNSNNNNNSINIIYMEPMEGFYTIKDAMKLLHWGKTKVQKLFNMKEFPACDFGKEKVVSKQAFYNFFSQRRASEDYVYWRN